MRAYKDPTADMAIANVMREWKEKEEFKRRQEEKKHKKKNKRKNKHKHKHGNSKGRVRRSSLLHLKEDRQSDDRDI